MGVLGLVVAGVAGDFAGEVGFAGAGGFAGGGVWADATVRARVNNKTVRMGGRMHHLQALALKRKALRPEGRALLSSCLCRPRLRLTFPCVASGSPFRRVPSSSEGMTGQPNNAAPGYIESGRI